MEAETWNTVNCPTELQFINLQFFLYALEKFILWCTLEYIYIYVYIYIYKCAYRQIKSYLYLKYLVI